MIPVIYPYRMSSQSAKDLARGLGCKRVFPNGHYQPKRNHMLINWGSTTFPQWNTNLLGCLINSPTQVAQAANKVSTFEALQRRAVPIPEWTTDINVAKAWEGTVFVRNTLTGRGGQGIIVINNRNEMEIPQALLYTRYTNSKHEYRVHVVDGHIIDFTRKKKFRGVDVNPYIKNHSNGWVFCREGVELPEIVADAAKQAVSALSLHFGAVDIAHKVRDNKVFVYEINTAPGIEETTLQKYINTFKGMF